MLSAIGLNAWSDPGERSLSAESDAGEHPFEHGKERLVGVGLAGAGPGEQGGLAEGDYGEPAYYIRLNSEAGFYLVIAGIGATDGAGKELWAMGGGRGAGHQRRRMPVHGYLDHI